MTAGADVTAAAVVFGLAAGACFALGTVLQSRAARQAPGGEALRASLLVDLARRPAWRWGIAAAVGSYGLQALALSLGPIALVEPLIVTDLLFALPLAARLAGRRLGTRERVGAALVVIGLVTFLLVSSPTAGVDSPSTFHWIIVIAAIAAVIAVALLAARGPAGVRRTSLLAVAAGVSLGLMSALTKTFTGLLGDRGFGAFASWQPYALAVVGFTGLLLSQSAFQAGPLAISLPLIDILEPVVAVLIAATVFSEKLAVSPWSLTLEAISAALVAAGISTLDRSPLVLAAQEGALADPTTDHQSAGGTGRPASAAGSGERLLVLDRRDCPQQPSTCPR